MVRGRQTVKGFEETKARKKSRGFIHNSFLWGLSFVQIRNIFAIFQIPKGFIGLGLN